MCGRLISGFMNYIENDTRIKSIKDILQGVGEGGGGTGRDSKMKAAPTCVYVKAQGLRK